ncbi:MAG TPA: hypothetical protein VIK35_03120 [Verrucomicrobiae bacterium]
MDFWQCEPSERGRRVREFLSLKLQHAGGPPALLYYFNLRRNSAHAFVTSEFFYFALIPSSTDELRMVIPSAAMPTVPLTVAVHALKKPCIYAGFNNLNTDGHRKHG